MGLATFRNTETGDLVELNEDWLTRFPQDADHYTRVVDADLADLEQKQREADVAALDARPYDDGTTAAEAPAPAAEPDGDDESEDTPPAPPVTRDERRF